MGDQGNGTHLDHDIRALVDGRHGRYVFLWLMQLTIGEEREMGRCEKECADFKQQKTDHRFSPAKFGDSRPLFFLPTVMLTLTRANSIPSSPLATTDKQTPA